MNMLKIRKKIRLKLTKIQKKMNHSVSTTQSELNYLSHWQVNWITYEFAGKRTKVNGDVNLVRKTVQKNDFHIRGPKISIDRPRFNRSKNHFFPLYTAMFIMQYRSACSDVLKTTRTWMLTKLMSFSPTTSSARFCSLKNSVPTPLKSHVIYKINCSECWAWYVGQTNSFLNSQLWTFIFPLQINKCASNASSTVKSDVEIMEAACNIRKFSVLTTIYKTKLVPPLKSWEGLNHVVLSQLNSCSIQVTYFRFVFIFVFLGDDWASIQTCCSLRFQYFPSGGFFAVILLRPTLSKS